MLNLLISNLPPILAILSVALLCVALWAAKPWISASYQHIHIRNHIHLLHKQGAHILENIYLRDRKGKLVYIE